MLGGKHSGLLLDLHHQHHSKGSGEGRAGHVRVTGARSPSLLLSHPWLQMTAKPAMGLQLFPESVVPPNSSLTSGPELQEPLSTQV